MHKEIRYQKELLQQNPNLRNLPLAPADFANIKRVAWLEGITSALWKTQASLSWSESNFLDFFNIVFSNIHKNNFLVKVGCKGTTNRIQEKLRESLTFEMTVSPAILYRENISKTRVKDILNKSKDCIKRELLLCLEQKANWRAFKVAVKDKNTVGVNIMLLPQVTSRVASRATSSRQKEGR
jgi:hypothetical protein